MFDVAGPSSEKWIPAVIHPHVAKAEMWKTSGHLDFYQENMCENCLILQDHHLRNGYQLLYTPHVAKAEMWKTSGHLDFYSENMFDRIKVLL